MRRVVRQIGGRGAAVGAVAVAVTLSCVGGCGMLPELAPPKLSAALDYVVKNPGQFVVTDGGRLKDVPAGAVIDDIRNLNGCWGREAPLEPLPETPMSGLFHLQLAAHEALQFDLDKGEMTTEGYEVDAITGIGLAIRTRARVTVLDDHRIRLETYSFAASDPTTGEMVEYDPPTDSGTDGQSGSTAAEIVVTVSGDQMRLSWNVGSESGEAVNNWEDQVFARFGCP